MQLSIKYLFFLVLMVAKQIQLLKKTTYVHAHVFKNCGQENISK